MLRIAGKPSFESRQIKSRRKELLAWVSKGDHRRHGNCCKYTTIGTFSQADCDPSGIQSLWQEPKVSLTCSTSNLSLVYFFVRSKDPSDRVSMCLLSCHVPGMPSDALPLTSHHGGQKKWYCVCGPFFHERKQCEQHRQYTYLLVFQPWRPL